MFDTTKSERELREAVENGEITTVKGLVNSRNVKESDHYGRTLLYLAAFKGRYDMCKLLLEKKAVVDKADNSGWTPLIVAAIRGNQQICKLLLQENANVNFQDKHGLTPLMRAASNGDQQICQLLLINGAEVNLKDKDGCSALMKAVQLNFMDVCKCLLDHDADIDLKNNAGKTALALSCIDEKYAQIKDMLEAQSFIRKKKETLKEREEYENLQELQKINSEIERAIHFLQHRNGKTDAFLQNSGTRNRLYNVLRKHKAEYEEYIEDSLLEIQGNNRLIAVTKNKITLKEPTDINADKLREEVNRLEDLFKEDKYKEIVEI